MICAMWGEANKCKQIEGGKEGGGSGGLGQSVEREPWEEVSL